MRSPRRPYHFWRAIAAPRDSDPVPERNRVSPFPKTKSPAVGGAFAAQGPTSSSPSSCSRPPKGPRRPRRGEERCRTSRGARRRGRLPQRSPTTRRARLPRPRDRPATSACPRQGDRRPQWLRRRARGAPSSPRHPARRSRRLRRLRRGTSNRRRQEARGSSRPRGRSEEHTSELQSQSNLVCPLLLGKKLQEAYEGAKFFFPPLFRYLQTITHPD